MKNFSELHVDSRSENKKVYLLNKYFRNNQNADQDFWIYGGYENIINNFVNFNDNDLNDLIIDFDYWNSEDLWIFSEFFAFIEDYDTNNKLREINSSEFYCILFINTNESDSNDLLVNLNYVLNKNKNVTEENLHQVKLKVVTLKNSNKRTQPNELYDKALEFIEQIENSSYQRICNSAEFPEI